VRIIRAQRNAFDAANAEAASVIVANPSRYGGHGGAMVLWAERFLTGRKPNDASGREPHGQGSLFGPPHPSNDLLGAAGRGSASSRGAASVVSPKYLYP
jgi:hypothetical protein